MCVFAVTHHDDAADHFTFAIQFCNAAPQLWSQPDLCDIFGGTSQDCNTNGVPDLCDIFSGTSEDCNTNGIPDECEIPGLADMFAPDVLYGAGDWPASVAVGDLDDDGDLD